MKTPDLADLALFAAVAEAGGFRAAAGRRGLSAASLSDAVQRLERRTGMRLLNRTTRSVTPTDAGRRLLERLGPALAEIDAAFDALSEDDEPAGTLRLDVPGIVARHVLPPIASGFLLAHPRIRMEVSLNENLVDVLAAGCDAGIRYEEHLERDMIAAPIGPRRQRYVAAAAPAYLAAHGAPEHPRDLAQHTCIRHRFAGGRINPWVFERDGEVIRLSVDGPLISDSVELEVVAAVAGVGVIFTFEEFLRPELDRGDLLPILSDWPQVFSGPYLYYPSRRQMPPPLRAFIDFIKGHEGTADA